MPNAPSSVLHVVVGAGIIPYFRNAIDSILRNTDGLVFAVYNAISPLDMKRISRFITDSDFGSRVVFRTLGNKGSSKTGSLYVAYNLALDFAAERNFSYVNFVQADCQLMWWSDTLVKRLDEIYIAAKASGVSAALCVGTTFPTFGKYVGSVYPSDITYDSDLGAFAAKGAAVTDVAIFSMSAVRAAGFRFVGTESEMQDRYQSEKVPVLDAPCVAFIPWPASVRDGKVVGTVVDSVPGGAPILRLKEGFPPGGVQASRAIEPYWMEDWVVPNGWDCLFPYWPTSIDHPKWLKRRLDACRAWGVKPWATAGEVFGIGQRSFFSLGAIPTRIDILVALGVGYRRALLGYFARAVKSVAKRLSPHRK